MYGDIYLFWYLSGFSLFGGGGGGEAGSSARRFLVSHDEIKQE